MPTAEPFTFLGAGNGFNNCLLEDPELTPSNGITYTELMNCFYNIGTINVFCQYTNTKSEECDPPTFTIKIDKLELSEPRDRVCQFYYKTIPDPNDPYKFTSTKHPWYRENTIPSADDGTSFYFEGTEGEPCYTIDFVNAYCGVDVRFKPTIDDSGDGIDSNFNLSEIGEDFYSFPSPAIEVYIVADSDYFLDYWQMWYFTFDASSLLNPDGDQYGWRHVDTVNFEGITFYGMWEGYDPYDSSKHPHITSIEPVQYS